MKTRRDFLGRLATGAAVASIAPAAFPALASAATPGDLGEDTPLAPSMAQELESAFLAEEWDLSWTKRLTGKHRAVFDSPSLDGGAGVFRSGMWLRQYGDVLKLTPGDMHSVIVIRHAAIGLAMNQAFWDEYELAKKAKLRDDNGKKTTKNPAIIVEGNGVPASFASLSIDKQIANGVIVLACNLAFGQMVSEVAKKHKIKGEEARAKAKEGLIPGVILQPSGFFATTLAGENGCVYVRAS